MGTWPREPIASARRIWKRTERSGDMKWLENPAFISANCFKPPPPSTQHRAWDRVAVPTAAASRSNQKIHKRINIKAVTDRKYCAVVAELEVQSLHPRKSARSDSYVVPYGSGGCLDNIRPGVTGEQDLEEARVHVEIALDGIWKDNLRLQEYPFLLANRRSSFDPAQLTWVPRKRHNSRWPVIPPTEHVEFLAKLQPLIRFEVAHFQLDEPGSLAQEESDMQNGADSNTIQQNSVPQSPRKPEPSEPVQQSRGGKSSHRRRRTLRPSLSTISEATEDTPVFPVSTPGSSRPVCTSPLRRLQATPDTSKTPTKVAESTMKNFTISATPKSSEIQVTDDQSDRAIVPLAPATESVASHAPVLNHGERVQFPSASNAGSATNLIPVVLDDGHLSAPVTMCSDHTSSLSEISSAYFDALPLFDQPIPKEQVEPEYESRRRFSLDNARRSDRTSDVRIIKRVQTWMAGSTVGRKRRYSDVGGISAGQQAPKRRHTLDVDAGTNPDIFGQWQTLPAPTSTPTKSVAENSQPGENSQGQNLTVPPMLAETPPHGLEGPSIHKKDGIAADTAGKLDHRGGELIGEEDSEASNDAITTIQTENDSGTRDDDDSEDKVESEDDEGDVEGDSDMAYLQSFVQRSRSTKVPSAPIFVKSSSKKRRSSSTGSGSTGTPEATATTTTNVVTTTTSPRVPLGEKDANKSPSPSKKRKLKGLEQQPAAPIKKSSRLVAPDLDDLEPSNNKRRKRRKGAESDTDDVFNPNMDTNQVLTQRSGPGGAGSRRSNRIATVQRVATPAISVRLPGSVFTDSGDMPAISTAGINGAIMQRKLDQELAKETRVNTRKNRGALSVHSALAALANRPIEGDETNSRVAFELKKGETRDRKAVRWDEVLVRVQTEEADIADPAEVGNTTEPELALATASEPVVDDEQAENEPAFERPGNPVASQLGIGGDEEDELSGHVSTVEPGLIRRSSRAATASRLPKRGGTMVTATSKPMPAPAVAPVQTPKSAPRRSSLLPAPSRVSKSGGRGGASAAVGAAETRARLGMAGPGTPGPRRGGRRRP